MPILKRGRFEKSNRITSFLVVAYTICQYHITVIDISVTVITITSKLYLFDLSWLSSYYHYYRHPIILSYLHLFFTTVSTWYYSLLVHNMCKHALQPLYMKLNVPSKIHSLPSALNKECPFHTITNICKFLSFLLHVFLNRLINIFFIKELQQKKERTRLVSL
jgi:hypothetical protein